MINNIINNNITLVKSEVFSILNDLVSEKLSEAREIVASTMFGEVEELEEASNVIKIGRTQLIRRRIRRKNGRIVVQRNIRRSAVKGFTLRGGKMKRITAMQKIRMKRSQRRGAIKRRAHKQQILRKRMISIRRRKSLGIR